MAQLIATNVTSVLYTSVHCVHCDYWSSVLKFIPTVCVTMSSSITLQGPTTVQHMHNGRHTCLVIQVCLGAEQNDEPSQPMSESSTINNAASESCQAQNPITSMFKEHVSHGSSTLPLVISVLSSSK